jgi:hypothetical protein
VMAPKKALLILSLCILCGCSTAIPGSDVTSGTPAVENATGPGPYTFDCNAEWGQDKQLRIRMPGGKLKVGGTISFLTTRRPGTARLSTASVVLVPSGKPPRIALVSRVTGDTTRISFGCDRPRNCVFANIPFTAKPMPFSLQTDQTGTGVSASFGDIVAPTVLSASGLNHVVLSCSTTHVLFSDVTIVALK